MQLWVTDDAEYLYYGVVIENIANYPNWGLQMNTDADHTTGYQLDWVWQQGSTGSDFVVENGTLKSHTTNTTDWAPLNDVAGGVVFFEQRGNAMEMKIAKSALTAPGKSLSSSIGFGMELKDSNWVLTHATNSGNLQTPMHVYTFTN